MACYGRQVLGTMCDWYMVSRVFLTLHPLARGRDGVWVWMWVGGRWEGGKVGRPLDPQLIGRLVTVLRQ